MKRLSFLLSALRILWSYEHFALYGTRRAPDGSCRVDGIQLATVAELRAVRLYITDELAPIDLLKRSAQLVEEARAEDGTPSR